MSVVNLNSSEREKELRPLLNDNSYAEHQPDSSQSPTKQRCGIDITMIPSKISIFCYEGFSGMIESYLTVFLTSVGLNVKEAGFISGIRLLSSLVATPLLGFVIDWTGRRRLVFLFLCLIGTVCYFPLPWVASHLQHKTLMNSSAHAHNITRNMRAVPHEKPFVSILFKIMLLQACLSTMCLYPLEGIAYHLAKDIAENKKADFGTQCLFGGLGYAICNAIAGFTVHYFKHSELSEFTGSFYVFLLVMVLMTPFGLIANSQLQLIAKTQAKNETCTKIENKGLHRRIKMFMNVCCNLQNIIFILCVLVFGLTHLARRSFLFQAMRDEMHASSLSMGFANFCQGVSEVFAFYFSKQIMSISDEPAISLIIGGGFVSTLQLIVFSFLKNQWLVLPSQLLTGFAYAIFTTSSFEYAYRHAPVEIHTTIFSIVCNTKLNVGGMIGNFGGGTIYHHYGGPTLYFGLSGLSSAWFTFALIYFLVKTHCRKIKDENLSSIFPRKD